MPIGRPRDRWELEADRIADALTADGLTIPARAHGSDPALPPDAASSCHACTQPSLGVGRRLPEDVRAPFEARLGRSLAHVRVHVDDAADAAARDVHATAFTVGDHIAFRSGAYAPGTPAGRRLLAHELAHTIQAAQAPQRGVLRRQPADDADAYMSPAGVGADIGLAPENMSWEQLNDAIIEHETFLAEQIETSPEVREREVRLTALRAEQRRQAARARQPRRRGRRRGPLPERPLSLSVSLDLRERSADELKAEVDRIVRYLAAGPPADEREVLEYELSYLEEAVAGHRAVAEDRRRSQRLRTALDGAGASGSDDIRMMLRRIETMSPDPAREGVWLLHHGDNVLALTEEEADAVRRQVGSTLRRSSLSLDNFAGDVRLAWSQRTEQNRSQPIVHALVSWRAGVEDIPRRDMDTMTATSQKALDKVRKHVRAGEFTAAAQTLDIQQNYVQYWAKKVGDWQGSLVENAGDWVTGLTILKEGLSVVAGVGATGLVTRLSAGQGVLGTLKTGALVTGGTTFSSTAGGVGAAALVGDDPVAALRPAAAEGFGIGAQTLAVGTGKFASLDDVAKATSRLEKAKAVGLALGVDTGLGVATDVTKATIGGEDVRTAAVSALASGPVSSIGGALVDKFADRRVTKVVGSALLSGGQQATSAAIADKDVAMAFALGFFGGGYGKLTATQGSRPDGGAPPIDEGGGSSGAVRPEGSAEIAQPTAAADDGPGPTNVAADSAATDLLGVASVVDTDPAPGGGATSRADASPAHDSGSEPVQGRAANWGDVEGLIGKPIDPATLPDGYIPVRHRDGRVTIRRRRADDAATQRLTVDKDGIVRLGGGGRVRRPTSPWLNQMRRQIAGDASHPLGFLLVPTGPQGALTWRRTIRVTRTGKLQKGRFPGSSTGVVVQVGHAHAFASGAAEHFMLEDADLNILGGSVIESRGAYSFKRAADIRGVPVDMASAMQWERLGLLPTGTVAAAPVIEIPIE